MTFQPWQRTALRIPSTVIHFIKFKLPIAASSNVEDSNQYQYLRTQVLLHVIQYGRDDLGRDLLFLEQEDHGLVRR